MGLVTGVSHLLILAEVLHGCSSIISLSLRCFLRCNRAKKKKIYCSITLCLSVSVWGGWEWLCIWHMDLLCWFVSNYSLMTFSLILRIAKQLRVIMILMFQVQGCEVCSGVEFWKSGSSGWACFDSLLAHTHELHWLLANYIVCLYKNH